MALDVSGVDRSLLANAPLTSVICQVRFDASPRASEARVVQELRDRLGGAEIFPQLEQIAENSVSISIAQNVPSLAQQVSATGWRMRARDGASTVALLPSSVSLEVFAYTGWDAFAAQLDQVLAEVAATVQPVFEQRLGLRYINQIAVPDARSPRDWQGQIDESFLGLGSHDEIGPLVMFSRQQAVLELDEESRCTINQGFAPDEQRDGALTYVLDFDIAREGTRQFDRGELNAAAARFNAYALRLFQIATSPELRSMLAQ